MAVDTLINELGEDLDGYATHRRFPRELPLEEAVEIAEFLHEQVDHAVEARAQAIARSSLKVACTRGCNGCCEEPIMVFRPESARVARWLAQPEQTAVREAFVAAYGAWNERIGDALATLSQLHVTDPKNYVTHHVEAWRAGVLCPFNRDGDCTVYPVRPTVCRTAHALETSEHCSGTAETPATRATFVPLDDFVARSRRLLVATHNATPGDRWRPEALPHAVHALLASRNTVP